MASIPSIAPYTCPPTTPAFTPITNCDDQPARIAYLAAVKASYTFTDLQDATEWGTAIAAGNIIVIPFNGSLPRASATKTTGKGLVKEKLTGYDWSVTGRCDNPDGNLELFNGLNRSQGVWSAIFVTADFIPYIPMTDTADFLPVAFDVVPVIEGDLQAQREGDFIVTWSTIEQPYTDLAGVPRSVFV